ncbi:glycoside hydrolase family 95 protein [Pontibacter chitinilyticus]|uniref:glycoside hydrolase family 95 protein n=1 Tax=Pontibacter chitinilyticus TaxID=2674989 RepID=UPI00321B759E
MRAFLCCLVFNLAFLLHVSAQNDSQLKLWYTEPAHRWVEALPVGNGRLGAMVYGDPAKEVIQLNENTVWAGQPNRNDNPQAKEALPEVRRLIFEGKYDEAQKLVNQKFISKTSQGMPYETVGNLRLLFEGHENYTNYHRALDLEKALTTSRYRVNGVNYKTEVFSSFPDQVIVVHLMADKPGAISFSATMDRPENAEVSTRGGDELILSGRTGSHEGVEGKVQFQARASIQHTGGIVKATESSLQVEQADEVTIYLSIASNFNNYKDISGNAGERADAYLQKALKKGAEAIRKDHEADYKQYFDRVSIDLGETEAVNLPTDQRIAQFQIGSDPALVALYFQFGRYLLISASRPGGQPANLQGIWNDQLTPPWDSKYTVNINTEMNYWPSEITNLTELNEPLIQMVRELSESGRQTARAMYGADGWMLHHNTDIWRISGPVDGAFWGMWPMGGAWLSQQLFDKYEFSGDKRYLASVYPILKEASKFYLDFLVEEPEHKWLVIAPSVSPENAPTVYPESSISAGTTMDNQLIFDLFNKSIKAAEVLNTDEALVAEMKESLQKLPPMQIGKWGQLQEWMQDWDNPKDHHRHVSHLYGLYPSNQISPYRHPALYNAARTSLLARGDESTGWSMGWKVNLWARLLDGNHALKLIEDQLSPAGNKAFGEGGGTYPNLFDAHPPFQIDGNFGCAAGIAEMLLQSQDGAVHILPALPDAWAKGSISGLRARGGFGVDIKWEDNAPGEVTIRSAMGGNCRIRSYYPLSGKGLKLAKGANPNPFYQIAEIKEPLVAPEADLKSMPLRKTYEYDLKTKPGGVYVINLAK